MSCPTKRQRQRSARGFVEEEERGSQQSSLGKERIFRRYLDFRQSALNATLVSLATSFANRTPCWRDSFESGLTSRASQSPGLLECPGHAFTPSCTWQPL
ncbi:hypothetical protein M413DRAFT_132451 [Hebeloma cylindrosporum]|uniref:Uncharacterized protein n=1 Tax=Hebeloma cylindrosporum TaxID=76867 RepID=A0A0C2XXH3_HEBCY|nr:hypothetical protein M413DRAFT_132451 [Hebeloma cylindrosporum h7]